MPIGPTPILGTLAGGLAMTAEAPDRRIPGGPVGRPGLFVLALATLTASIALGLSATRGRPDQAAEIPPLVVDVNTAPVGVLEALPGLGPALSARIVEEREAAPFRTPEEVDRVKGIGPAKLRAIRPYLRVEDEEQPASDDRPTP